MQKIIFNIHWIKQIKWVLSYVNYKIWTKKKEKKRKEDDIIQYILYNI